MGKIIVVASQKGGSGKTTVALNVAVALAERGQRSLLVDLDPQGGVGLSLAKGETELGGLAEWLAGELSAEAAVVPTKLRTLSLLPRGRLDPRDALAFEAALGEAARLRAVLSEVGGQFDRIVLDTPSGLGSIPRAALAVGDYVLTPMQAEKLALRSSAQLLQLMAHIREHDNPHLLLLGVVPTMVDLTQTASVDVMTSVWSELSGVLDTVIPRSEAFAAASSAGLPVGFLGGTRRPEARRFELLADELETRMGEQEDHHEQRALL